MANPTEDKSTEDDGSKGNPANAEPNEQKPTEKGANTDNKKKNTPNKISTANYCQTLINQVSNVDAGTYKIIIEAYNEYFKIIQGTCGAHRENEMGKIMEEKSSYADGIMPQERAGLLSRARAGGRETYEGLSNNSSNRNSNRNHQGGRRQFRKKKGGTGRSCNNIVSVSSPAVTFSDDTEPAKPDSTRFEAAVSSMAAEILGENPDSDDESMYDDDESYTNEMANACMHIVGHHIKKRDAGIDMDSIADTSGYDGATIEASYQDDETLEPNIDPAITKVNVPSEITISHTDDKEEYFDVEEQEFYSCDLYDGYHNPDFRKGRV